MLLPLRGAWRRALFRQREPFETREDGLTGCFGCGVEGFNSFKSRPLALAVTPLLLNRNYNHSAVQL
jgi:hypothetical protein